MSLPPIYGQNLKIVFIGTEPGATSKKIGHYYADTNNSFYKDLYKTGFLSRIIKPEEDQTLPSYLIGLDDVYKNPQSLIKRLELHKPASVCFNSKEALVIFLNIDNAKRLKNWAGKLAGNKVSFPWNPIVWALYDSSGKAKSHHEKRINLLFELRKILYN